MRFALLVILALFSVSAYAGSTDKTYRLHTVAQGLNYPWSIAFLPNGDYLVSMRSGELRTVAVTGEVSQPLTNTPATYVAGQGGYFDVVLDPDFNDNHTIYLAFAYGTPKANGTRVVSARLNENSLDNITPIYTVEPLKDTSVHYGGRLQFINDGTLLITSGDGFEYREASQDKFNQLGKIIRINKDGSVPADNPYADGKNGDPKVYSYGHRNPQGLSYDAVNNIVYMHEHGPKGGDEVNIIEPGKNYGWPAVSYGKNYSGALVSPFTEAEGIENPIKYWTPSIAPSGLSFYEGDAFPQWRGSLFIGALVDQEVRRLTLLEGGAVQEESLFSDIGERIRDVRQGPDSHLYILTDSPEGRVIRVMPSHR